MNTPTGQRSTLFDKLMGMAPVSSSVKAAKAMMTVYSPRFKERFGDWERVSLVNKGLSRLKHRSGDTNDASGKSGRRLYRRLESAPPKKTRIGYKVFELIDGKLYPPMVGNLDENGNPVDKATDKARSAPTEVGVWLQAEASPIVSYTKTGRPQVSDRRGKNLAYRPGWHLGVIPYAKQFNRLDKESGKRELFPRNFVWAEVEYAADVDYQEEADATGVNANGKYQHSLVALRHVPEMGYYRYRTNPDVTTDDWIITGAMKVNRVLKPSEVDKLVEEAGRSPQRRQDGSVTDEDIDAINKSLEESRRYRFIGERGAGRISDPILRRNILGNLSLAKMMNSRGRDMRTIWKSTGWRMLPDGKWRYEMPDNLSMSDYVIRAISDCLGYSEYSGQMFPLSDAVNKEYYDEIVSEYPDAADIYVSISPDSGNAQASFDDRTKVITIYPRMMLDVTTLGVASTLIHEMQHFIQEEEGLSRGGSSEYVKRFSSYKSFLSSYNDKIREVLDKINDLMMSDKAYASIAKRISDFNDRKSLLGDMFTEEGYKLVNDLSKAYEELYNVEEALNNVSSHEEMVSLLERRKRIDEEIARIEALDPYHMTRPMTADEADYISSLERNRDIAMRRIQATDEYKALESELSDLNEKREGIAGFLYRRLYGEIEARNAATRFRNISNDDIANLVYEWEETMDVDPSSPVIFIDNDGSNESVGVISYAAVEAGSSLNVNVTLVTSDQISEMDIDDGLKSDMMASKGWYDEADGRVYVLVDNNVSEEDARLTVMHEVLAHKGLRELLGDRFDSSMRSIFDMMDDASKSKYLSLYGNEATAAEEYLAHFAEEYVEPSVMDRIVAFIRDLLRSVFNIGMSKGDVMYLLYRSKENLSRMDNVMEEKARMESSDIPGGVTYPSGEPRLFFRSGDGKVRGSYGDAMRASTNGSVTAGFLAGSVGDQSADMSVEGTDVVLNNEEAFIPVMTVDAKADVATRHGYVNYLVKKGLLSGERVRHGDKMVLEGAGETELTKLINAADASNYLKARFGGDAATVDYFGGIEFDTEVSDREVYTDNDGNPINLTREQAEDMVRSGRSSELERMTDSAPDIIASMILDASKGSDTSIPLSKTMEMEGNAIRATLMDILSSLGIRVIGMQEYIDNYATRKGVPMTVNALADLSNRVIALAEGATVNELAEEVAHFLIDTYKNQEEINEVLSSVRGTEEWSQHAKHYYEVYGKDYQGAELDRMVEREILGKVLARKFTAGMASDVDTLESSNDSHLSLLARIIRAIRNLFTNQRSRMDAVLDRIRRYSMSGDMSVFDPSLITDAERVMYSSADINYGKRMMRYKRTLQRTYNSLQSLAMSRTALLGETMRSMVGLEDALRESEKVSDSMNKESVISAVHSIVSTAEAQVRYMVTASRTMRDSGLERIDYDTYRIIDEVYNNMIPLLKSLMGMVRGDAAYFTEMKSLVDRMSSTIASAETAHSDIVEMRERSMDDFLEKQFEVLSVNPRLREKVKKGVNSIIRDIGVMARFFGTLEHSSNPVLSMLGAALGRVAVKSRADAIQRTNKLMGILAKYNFKISDYERIIAKNPDDTYSDYLLSSRDLAKYDYNRRREEASILIDIYDLENIHPDMSREDMIKAIMSDKGFKTKRRVQRPKLDKDGNKIYKIEGDREVEDLETVELNEEVTLMAGRRPMNFRVMETRERAEYDRRMKEWYDKNDERPYLDEYYNRISDVEKIVRENPTIDDNTFRIMKEFLSRVRKDKFAVLSRFLDENGEVDEVALASDRAALDALQSIDSDRRAAKSSYNTDGTEKTGDAKKLAEAIQEWDRAWTDKFSGENKRRLSRKMRDLVAAIQREQGSKAAFEFLLAGSNIGFKSEMWGESMEDRFRKKTENYDFNENDDKMAMKFYNAAEEIKNARERISAILSPLRRKGRYGEYDISQVKASDRAKIEEEYNIISRNRNIALAVLNYFGVDPNEVMDIETTASQSYLDLYNEELKRDPNLKEYDFAKRYMTNTHQNMMDGLKRRMDSLGKKFTAFEKAFLLDYFGPNYMSALQDVLEEKRNGDSERYDKALTMYSRRLLLPYCKLHSPLGYSTFEMNVENGSIDIVEFLDDLENGISPENSKDKYNFDINLMRLDFDTRWLEENESVAQYRNPSYDNTLGYGAHLPKKELYHNQKYYDFYGIDPNNEKGEATQNKPLWELQQAFIEINRETMADYSDQWRGVYGLPQISKTMVERIHTSFHSVGGAIKNYMRDVAGERIDDPLYGQRIDGADEEGARAVPKYYVYKLENADDVSHDLGYAFAMMALQGARYKNKTAALGDIMGYESLLRRMEFEGGKVLEGTHSYRMLKDWVDANIYDVRVNGAKIEWDILGHRVNVAKLLATWTRWMSSFNIGFSHVVALTGALTGHTNILIEGALGSYVDKSSVQFGYGEAMRQAGNYMNEVGELNRKNKLYVIGENSGLFDMRNRVMSPAFNKIWRTLFRDLPYKMMEILNSPVDLTIIASVGYDTRLFKTADREGKPGVEIFGSFNDFKLDRLDAAKESGRTITEDSIREEWKSLEKMAFYNMIDTSEGTIKAIDPKYQEKIDAYFPNLAMKMRSMSQVAGGYLNDDNKVSASRNMLLNLVLQHRGWLINSVQRAYKKRNINMQAGIEEEGYMRTFGSLLQSIYKTSMDDKRWGEILQVIKEEYDKLEPHEKRNINRAALDLGTLAMFNVLAFVALGYRDHDEDDWIAQYSTYIAFRWMNETMSQTGTMLPLGMIDVLQEPLVSARKLGDMVNLPAWVGTVETGVYEGYPAAFRQLMKLTWGKQLFNYMNADNVRQTSNYWMIMNKMTIGFATKWPEMFLREAS